MQIQKIHFHHVRIPLQVVFAQTNQQTTFSDGVIIRMQTTEGHIGFGESCPRPYVSGEDAKSVGKAITTIQETLLQLPFNCLDDIKNWVLKQLDEGFPPAAMCAIELALLNVWSSKEQLNLLKILGGQTKDKIQYSGVVPHGSWRKLSAVFRRISFSSLKFKAFPRIEENSERVSVLRNAFGPDIPLRTDANGEWTYETARTQITASLAIGLNSFEQPLKPERGEAAALLVKEFGHAARITADESLVTFGDAKRLIEQKQCNHFNLKISKHGGVFNTMRIYNLAKENNIPCQLGAYYGETSILTNAGMVVAQLATGLTAIEGGFGAFLLKKDLIKNPIMIDKKGQIHPIDYANFDSSTEVDELKLSFYSIETRLWKKKINREKLV